MHHKRRGPKSTRAGCLMCKPHKRQGQKKTTRVKGHRSPRNIDDLAREIS